jgi:hypothetical protein
MASNVFVPYGLLGDKHAKKKKRKKKERKKESYTTEFLHSLWHGK